MPKIITAEELAQREEAVISTACHLIASQGFAALTMDKIVNKLPFSKGSLYKQFNSTEEVLLAITNSGAAVLLEFMQRAYEFEGSSRERYLARSFSYFIYAQLYPIHFLCELEAISPIVREKASENRLIQGYELLNKFKKSSEQFVQYGIDCKDLQLDKASNSARVANCSWTSEFGLSSYAIASNYSLPSSSVKCVNVVKQRVALEEELFWMVNIFMDGLIWKPLSGEKDYKETWKKIKSSLFAKELEQLSG